MATEDTSEIDTKIASWLLKTTGAIWLAVLPAVGTAVSAVAEAHLSKTQLLCLAGAEAFSILALLVILRRAFARQAKVLSETKLALEAARAPKKEEKKSEISSLPPPDVTCMKVLRFLADRSDGAYAAHVAFKTSLSVGQVEFCFDQLLLRKLIRQYRADQGSGVEYAATPAARTLFFS